MQPLWETGWRVLNKLKTELLYDPAIPLLSKKSIQMVTLLPVTPVQLERVDPQNWPQVTLDSVLLVN